ncbi:MAG: MBOAT family O-acyltransferase [Nanoarchaeota archaeon]|nr:MBOAT family O-acyltransferase [Nanoarchaeota archaeon]
MRKWYIVISLISNLGVLAFFKYTDFAINTFNVIASWFGYQPQIPFLNVILPIGISFFTFQSMSYTLDVYYKKLEPTDSLFRFLLYVSFFPQLVAGPIIRAADFLPQMNKKIVFLEDNFKSGLTLVMWGLVKKVVIADNIAVFVNAFFTDPTQFAGSLAVILGAIAFTIQIYCDFSAYSDIAIGVARMIGFTFMLNFDKPFFSKSIAEFWKRWHISLSTWFRDYLFTPLMGRKFTMTRVYCSVFIVFLVSGLWHGAGWNFVSWGFLHGFFLIVSMSTEKWRYKFNTFIGLTKLPKFHGLLKTMITLYLVVFSLLLFRLYNADFIIYAARKFIFIDFSQFLVQAQALWSQFQVPLLFIIVFIIVHIYTYFKKGFLDQIVQKGSFEWTMYLISMILIMYLFSPTESIQFIYFQF